jgi:hypothetical protein
VQSEPDDRRGVAHLRLGALALVAALVLSVRALEADPGSRRAALLLVTLGLGYGHQLGGLWFGRRARRPLAERGLRAYTLLTAGLAFALALASPAAGGMMIALAAIGAWHVIENDLAQNGGAATGTRLPPLPREPARHAVPLLASALAVIVAFALPACAPALVAAGAPPSLAVWTPEEVIALLLLYHVLAWAGRSLGAAAPGPARLRRAALLAGVHALPLVALLGLRELTPGLYSWVSAPAIYLFLSAAHAVQTCIARGLAPASVTNRGRFPHAWPTSGWGP